MAGPFPLIVDLVVAGLAALTLWRAWRHGDPVREAACGRAALLLVSGIGVAGLASVAHFGLTLAVPAGLLATTTGATLLAFQLLAVPLVAGGLLLQGRVRDDTGQALERSADALQQAEADAAEVRIAAQALRELSADALYCFRFTPPVKTSLPVGEQVRRSYDAVLVDCNDVFASQSRARSRSDFMGVRLGDLRAAEDTSLHDRMMADFIRSGYRLDGYDRTYVTASGQPRPVRVWLRGIVEDGCLRSIWGREHDTRPMQELARTASREEEGQDAIARVSSRLLTSTNEETGDAIRASLRDACRYVDADRATIVWFRLETSGVEVLYHWNESGDPPTQRFDLGGFGWMAPLLLGGESVAFSSIDELPESARSDRESLRDMGIRSALVTPIVFDGETLGALSLVNLDRERTWSDRYHRGLRVIAACCGSAIARLRAQRRLDDALSELAAARDRLEAENVYLQQEILSSHGFNDIIGESDSLRRCLNQVAQVAGTMTPVLIQGETGTGKELIARAIHQRSERSDRPLVKVNCAALPASLIESELFGHERGAFTGAVGSKRGRFDLADGGTLFLDEIGDIAADLQAKLLRVLQDGEFHRVGGTKTVRTDVRIIAATNRNLQEAVENGQFRADLFYRINTFTIEVPALREREGDIALLAQHFVTRYAQQLGKRIDSISQAMLDQLEAHDWPGNVRELEGVIQRSLITADGPALQLARPLRSVSAARDVGGGPNRVQDLRSAEIAHIRDVLERCDWKIAGQNGAAARLGLPESTLRSRMKKFGIERPAPIA